jgi:hypothetical protein
MSNEGLLPLFGQNGCKSISLQSGIGVVERTGYGAFVVYSRTSLSDLLMVVQDVRKDITSLDKMSTIFLMGPTPVFYGPAEGRAKTSWRRDFLRYVGNEPTIDSDWLIVLPEPYHCDWSQVDYPAKLRMSSDEQIWAQIHWENHFIKMSLNKGVAVMHAYFRWDGNAGSTARCEAGSLLSKIEDGKCDRVVLNLPLDSQSVPYLEAHLLDAYELMMSGKFSLVRDSPTTSLDSFFEAIVDMTKHV